MATWLAKKLEIDPQTIAPAKPFADYGLTSVLAVTLAKDLSHWLGQQVEPIAAWKYPTVATMAAYLAGSSPQADDKTDLTVKLSGPASDLSELSDDKLSELLAAEIAQARHRTSP